MYCTHAGEDDLMDVMGEVMDMVAKWKPLGRALGLKPATLNTISSMNPNDPTECLASTLVDWLQQRYDNVRFGQPSWRLLCQAMHKPAGGNDPGLARKIAEQHTCTSQEPVMVHSMKDEASRSSV